MKAKGKKTAKEVVYDLYLSMTEREARVLYTLTRAVGGAPEGPRGVADMLSSALSDLGIRELKRSTVLRGTLFLPNTWEAFEETE